jgi:hypothetical protein
MSMRRVTKASVIALAGGLLAAPWAMHAALAATLTITPADGSKVSGTAVKLHATISGQNGNVQSWTVQLAKDAATPQFTTVSGCTTTATAVDCTWDTTHVLGNATAIAPNGKYLVKVSARDSGSLTAAAQTYTNQVGLFVQNGPATPSNLTVTKDEAAAQIFAAWPANPEPDISEYLLKETLPSGTVTTWHVKPPCSSSGCTFSRRYTAGGTYSYTVAAVRTAPNPDGSTATLTSAAFGPRQATVADPNPTTTTTTTQPPPTTTTGGGGSTTTTRGGSASGDTGTGGGDSGSAGNTDDFKGVIVNGFRITGIQGGNPGSVSSSRSFGGRAVQIGGGGEGSEADPGFSETLPFKKPQKDDQPSIAQSIVNIPSRVITDDSTRRAALQITAFGLLIFVLAMQIRYVTRRADEQA